MSNAEGISIATISVMTTDGEGNPLMVNEGDRYASDDPFVKARPELFGEDVPRKRTEPQRIERATRAPGEKRGPRARS